MNKKVILILIDGFGIGSMSDSKTPEANTLKSLNLDQKKYPNLKRLGIFDLKNDVLFKEVIKGYCALGYEGADSYLGHNEMMGAKYKKPNKIFISNNSIKIANNLKKYGYKVEIITLKNFKYLKVNSKIIILDNLENDPGMIINVYGAKPEVSFLEVNKVSDIVRSSIKISRIIAIAGSSTSVKRLEENIIIKNNCIGVITSKTGIYEKDYECIHKGYGIKPNQLLPFDLVKSGKHLSLIGKMQDVIGVYSNNIFRIPCIDTDNIFENIIQEIQKNKSVLIAATIQETDLAGHSQDKGKYVNIINKIEKHLPDIMMTLTNEDYLIITADHGNDPLITNKHTREFVPFIIYKKGIKAINIGLQPNLNSVAEFINQKLK